MAVDEHGPDLLRLAEVDPDEAVDRLGRAGADVAMVLPDAHQVAAGGMEK